MILVLQNSLHVYNRVIWSLYSLVPRPTRKLKVGLVTQLDFCVPSKDVARMLVCN